MAYHSGQVHQLAVHVSLGPMGNYYKFVYIFSLKGLYIISLKSLRPSFASTYFPKRTTWSPAEGLPLF